MAMAVTYGEQSAGLSTAESDCESMNGSKHSSISVKNTYPKSNIDACRPTEDMVSPVIPASPPPAAPVKPVSRRGLFSKSPSRGASRSKSPRPRSNRGSTTNTSSQDDDSCLNQSITNSAPTILIRTPSTHSGSSDDPSVRVRQPIRSAMSSRTLHESLHRGKAMSARPKMDRSVSFANVNIREYERVLGDNPSVTCGPPLSIGWGYSPEPISMRLEDYEEGKGLPRSSSEYLVPKAVRESMLREHADVSRREMVETIRAVQKEKARRRKTVVNLGMSKSEERVEGAKRKIKKILKPSTSYESLEAKLWDEAHQIAMEKAKRLEESIRRGESVSSRDLYRVGTPCNNILPSRRNSMPRLAQPPQADNSDASREGATSSKGPESETTSTTIGEHDISLESVPKYAPKTITKVELRRSSAGEKDELEEELSASKHRGVKEGQGKRGSADIVASETESEDIFAKLLLDDSARGSEQ